MDLNLSRNVDVSSSYSRAPVYLLSMWMFLPCCLADRRKRERKWKKGRKTFREKEKMCKP